MAEGDGFWRIRICEQGIHRHVDRGGAQPNSTGAFLTSDDPILVIGATGRVGRLVVAELLRAGTHVRALARRPHEARLANEVKVFGGDLTDPASLESALSSARVVFLVWPTGPATIGNVIQRVASHAERVVLLSSPHQTQHPFFQQPNPMAELHRAVEAAIAEAGIPATIIRPGMFASNAPLWWASMIQRGDVVRWPYGSVETAPIDERDIAAVASHLLLDAAHAGGDYTITGPDALSQAEQVRIISEVIGRPLRYEEISPDEFRRATGGVWPPAIVEMLLDAWRASVGSPAYVTDIVERITNDAPRTFHDWVLAHSAVFRYSRE